MSISRSQDLRVGPFWHEDPLTKPSRLRWRDMTENNGPFWGGEMRWIVESGWAKLAPRNESGLPLLLVPALTIGQPSPGWPFFFLHADILFLALSSVKPLPHRRAELLKRQRHLFAHLTADARCVCPDVGTIGRWVVMVLGHALVARLAIFAPPRELAFHLLPEL